MNLFISLKSQFQIAPTIFKYLVYANVVISILLVASIVKIENIQHRQNQIIVKITKSKTLENGISKLNSQDDIIYQQPEINHD